MKYRLLISLLFVCYSVFSQNQFDQIKKSYQFKNDSLSEILITLSRDFHCGVISNDSLSKNIFITQTFNFQNLNQILFSLSENHSFTFTFDQNNNLILLKKNSSYTGDIEIKLMQLKTPSPISDASFYFPELEKGGVSDSSGKIILKDFSAGMYKFIIRHLNYATLKGILICKPGTSNLFQFNLSETDIETEEIPIYSPMNELSLLGLKLKTFSAPDLKMKFNYFGDYFKSIQSIPGVQGEEFSSGFSINGGSPFETKIYIDGLEIFSPYHFDDFFRIAGIVNPNIVQRTELYLGGFSSQFGNSVSGIVNIKTLSSENNIWKLSGRNTQYSGFYSGSLSGSKILISGRYGNDSNLYSDSYNSGNLIPEYWDFYLKSEFQLSENQKLDFHFLNLGDHYSVQRNQTIWTPNIESKKLSNLFWISYQNIFSSRLTFNSLAYLQNVNKKTDFDYTNSFSTNNYDYRNYTVSGINSAINFRISERSSLSSSFKIQSQNLNLRFHELQYGNNISEFDSSNVNVNPVYYLFDYSVVFENKLTDNLLMISGLNLIRLTGQKYFLSDPRIEFLFNHSAELQLKLATGYYSQFQTPDELELSLEKSDYSSPIRSFQTYFEIQHFLPLEIQYHVSTYYKNYFSTNDDQQFGFIERYNYFNPPQFDNHINSGKSYGVNLLIRQDKQIFNWLIGYSYNQSKLISDTESFTRIYEQKHRLNLGLELFFPNDIIMNIFLTKRSGTPYTEQTNARLQPQLFPKTLFVSYGKQNDLTSESSDFLKIRLSKSYQFSFCFANFFIGYYNLLNYEPNYFVYTVTKEKIQIKIPVNKKLFIPQILFFGIELSDLVK